MKAKIFFPLCLVLFLCFSFTNCTAQMVHELVLSVEQDHPNKNEVASLTTISNTKVLENGPASKLTILADVGDSVLWKASSTNQSTEPVNIVTVEHLSGPRIFTSNTFTGESFIKATIVRGGEEEYVYKLHYTMGSASEMYSVIAAIRTKI